MTTSEERETEFWMDQSGRVYAESMDEARSVASALLEHHGFVVDRIGDAEVSGYRRWKWCPLIRRRGTIEVAVLPEYNDGNSR